MIIHVLVFFVCASLGTELWAGAFDKNRCDKEVEALLSGLSTDDANGESIEHIKTQFDCDNIGNLSIEHGKEDIIFKLYMKQTRDGGRKLIIDDVSSLRKSHFDASKPTYIITHGWLCNEDSPSCDLISNAYLINTDSNVIVVDWSWYSKSTNYIAVSNLVDGIAERVANLIKWLFENGLKPDDVTLIGHSLGAHVMGIAGYKLTPKVNNLVGLDPAFPMFILAKNSERISTESANHVQIIHTNAGYLGYINPCGHLDFYVNGGRTQPGCSSGLGGASCNHARAVDYFAESISHPCVGIACESLPVFKKPKCGMNSQYATMGGINLESRARPGMYYVRTYLEKPFC